MEREFSPVTPFEDPELDEKDFAVADAVKPGEGIFGPGGCTYTVDLEADSGSETVEQDGGASSDDEETREVLTEEIPDFNNDELPPEEMPTFSDKELKPDEMPALQSNSTKFKFPRPEG